MSISQFMKAGDIPKLPVKERVCKTNRQLQNWLNETFKRSRVLLERKALTRAKIPIEAGANLGSDILRDLEPLRSLGIDKATFEKHKINGEDMRRVYRGLYVSSKSLFDLLTDITQHMPSREERTILKTCIWNAYQMLVEIVHETEFKSLTAEID